jgi:two-component system, OmpR family, KDP operon response regulator KdpE
MTLAPKRLRALIIDDEKSIRRFLRTTLAAEDFDVAEAETAATGLALARETKPDLVVLDLGLPDGDGAKLITPILSLGAPAILVLSALDEETRKVTALDLGADDFVTKPFGVAEFMARVRAALRHRLRMQGGSPVYEDGRLSVDLVKRQVRVNGVDPKLTPREYALLRELVIHAGKVLTHRHLMAKCWEGPDEPDIQVLRVHMRNLRQKIEESPDEPALIVTEQGVGYRFLGKGEATAAT